MLADLRATLRRYCLRLALICFAAVVAAIGMSMGAFAAYLRLAEIMAAPWAAALTGSAALVLAGLAACSTRWVGARSDPKPAASPEASPGDLSGLLATLEAAIDADARSERPRFALVALTAGCALGASPRLRRILADFVR